MAKSKTELVQQAHEILNGLPNTKSGSHDLIDAMTRKDVIEWIKAATKETPEVTTTQSSVIETVVSGTVMEPQRSKPKDKDDGQIYRCGNSCGFNTRHVAAQALQDKTTHKAARTEAGQYLCPNCRRQGVTGKLVQYP